MKPDSAPRARVTGPGRECGRAGAVLAGLSLLLFRDAVFRGRFLYERDIHVVWQPQVESFVRSVLSGCWPVWDRTVGFGQPLLADPSAQVLYPFTWLNLLMPPWVFYTVLAVSHVAWAGLGLHVLARRLGASPGGALVGALAWTAGGPLLSLVNVWHHFASAAWIPWVLAAAAAAFERPTVRRGLVWAAALTAQVLAGSADMCVLTAGLTVLTAPAFLDLRRPRSWAPVIAVALLAGVLAAGLTAAQWLPTLEVARRSARWALPSEMRTYWSLHPLRLLQVVWPVFWNDLPLAAAQRDALFQGREPFLFSLYLGLPAVAFVGASLLRRRAWPWLVGLVSAALIALGRNAPAYGLAVTVFPPLAILRYPEKTMVAGGLCWAILCALGFEVWRSDASRHRLRWLLLAGAPAALLALATLWVGRFPERLGPWTGGLLTGAVIAPQSGRLIGAGLAGAVAVMLALGHARGPRIASALAAVLVVGDLVVAARDLNPAAPRAFYAARPPALEALRSSDHARVYVHEYFHEAGKSERLLGRPDPYRLARVVQGWPLRVSGALAMREYLLPPLPGVWGLEGSFEPDPRGLYSADLTAVTRLARQTEGSPAHLALLRLGAVGHVVALHDAATPGLRQTGTYPGMLADPIRVYEVEDPRPRAYLVPAARRAAGEEALAALLDPSFDPAREIVLPPEAPAATGAPRLQPFRGSALILGLGEDRVRVEADLSDRGYLVLVDAYDPGWRVRVDGEPAALLRANVAFRAVALGPGRHVVEMHYRPRGLLAGAVISILTLAVGGALLARRPHSRG